MIKSLDKKQNDLWVKDLVIFNQNLKDIRGTPQRRNFKLKQNYVANFAIATEGRTNSF